MMRRNGVMHMTAAGKSTSSVIETTICRGRPRLPPVDPFTAGKEMEAGAARRIVEPAASPNSNRRRRRKLTLDSRGGDVRFGGIEKVASLRRETDQQNAVGKPHQVKRVVRRQGQSIDHFKL